jgi:hypothetical protein
LAARRGAGRGRTTRAKQKISKAGMPGFLDAGVSYSLPSRRAPNCNRSRRYRSVVRNKGTVRSSREMGSTAVSRLRSRRQRRPRKRQPPLRDPTSPTTLLLCLMLQVTWHRCLQPRRERSEFFAWNSPPTKDGFSILVFPNFPFIGFPQLNDHPHDCGNFWQTTLQIAASGSAVKFALKMKVAERTQPMR